MIQAPKGTKDVLPQDSFKWQFIENIMRQVCCKYGVREVRTPVIEHTELFMRGVGEVTDIVQKEMYTFEDKGGRSISLKPEGTAGVARMFSENGLFNRPLPLKQFYVNNPLFRYENPQGGRLREHHQFGVEVFGTRSAMSDAEIIALALEVITTVGLCDLELNINSIGCPNCRPKYNEALKEFLHSIKGSLCKDCLNRMDTNPLRVLDCKNERCQSVLKDAPEIIDYLCEECEEHFSELKQNLEVQGIDYKINPRIVRGLDYYTKTVFEIISYSKGFEGTVCGGGRYDKLIEEVGGPDTGACGFGMGMERLLLVMQGVGIEIPEPTLTDVYICSMDRSSELYAIELGKELRAGGVKVELNHGGRSVKAQFKFADKLKAKFVIVIGGDEVESGEFSVKNMLAGGEYKVNRAQLLEFINKESNI